MRAHPRYEVQFRALLTGRWSDVPDVFWIKVQSIGEGGIGAEVPVSLPQGEIVLLDLMLRERILSLPALVRYQNGLLHGFQFIGTTEDQRTVIRNYCQNEG